MKAWGAWATAGGLVLSIPPRPATCAQSSHFPIRKARPLELNYGWLQQKSLCDTRKLANKFHPPRGSVVRAQNEQDLDCVGTGLDVECIVMPELDCVRTGVDVECVVEPDRNVESIPGTQQDGAPAWGESVLETLLLISPFFFWGTAMVAMKEVLPKAGPLFVAATRLIPSGCLLVGFAAWTGRKQPASVLAWLAIALFGLVDGSFFQGFLTEGLKRTSAGLGSVIIDSQPLTVAVLASTLFGESLGPLGVVGLATGVLGLLLLEVPPEVLSSGFVLADTAGPGDAGWSIWDSGEWWMLLAAQSMAVGTVMVRWVCKYSDPVMATGWHMVLGGLPLLALSTIQQDPALSGHAQDLTLNDWIALFYTTVFGSAVSYGVFFYNARKGSLTKLSSLTFLTPMFAAFFGFLFLNETLTPLQLFGASVTLVAIYMVNAKPSAETGAGKGS